MSDKLSCHIVKDLLPLMADGLVSEETSQEIKEHLETCEDCRRAYAAMTGAEETAQQEQKAQDEAQIDYLKKVRKRSKLPAVIVGCIAVLVLAVLGWRFFIRGGVDKQLEISAYVVDAETHKISAYAKTTSSALAVTGLDFSEKDGVVTVSGRTAMVGLKNDDEYGTYYTAKSEVLQIVDASGRVLWSGGTIISPHTGRMWQKRVKYVGNASAVNELKNTIWMPLVEYPYGGIELQTATEPYGVKITIGQDDIVQNEIFADYISGIAKKQGSLMLALVENLGYVEYEIHTGQADVTPGQKLVIVRKVTADDALEYAKERAADLPGDNLSALVVRDAKSIKDFGKDAAALEHLAEVIDMNNYYAIKRAAQKEW